MTPRAIAQVVLLVALATGCPGGTSEDGGVPDAGIPTEPPRFPPSFLGTYLEMRDCRHSHEHELRHIRVFASPEAQASYAALSPDVPYPKGATLVKLEYELPGCRSEDFREYTVLHKLSDGMGSWLWQRVAPDLTVLEQGPLPRCINCHVVHCSPPNGYDFTCAEEL